MHAPLRVMTFNIASSSEDDPWVVPANRWHNGRAAYNVQTILRYSPDVIGFQEIDSDNIATYDQGLNQYRSVLGPTIDHEHNLYNAIYWNPSMCDLIDSGGFWLSETPERYSRSWGAGDAQAATWVKLRHLPSGVTFVHINTHLDYASGTARWEGCKVILNHLSLLTSDGLPTILSGDFNGVSWLPDYALAAGQKVPGQHRLFLGAGFRDTFLEAGHHDSLTSNSYHHFQGDGYIAELPYTPGRIDWMLTRDGKQRITTHSCTIIRDQDPPLFASDHYPILAKLLFAT